jgi:two-component system sensor histidine kinase RegB
MLHDERHLKLILSLRWVAIAAQILVLVPALKLGWLQNQTRLPAVLIIATLAAFNAASTLANRIKFIRPTQSYLLTQLGFDLFAVCGLLWLTGGAWNPFIVLVLFHAALGALLLRGLHLIFFIMLLMWSSTALYSNPMIPPPALGSSLPSVILYPVHMSVMLSLVGLISWVSFRLENKRKEIEVAQAELQKRDHLRAFGVISTGFSHEFSTPLSTLQIRLKRLARHQPELHDNEDLQEALKSAKQCEEKLRSLLQRRGDVAECNFERIDLRHQLLELKAGWASQDTTLNIEVPNTPLEIRTPLASLRQVLGDLLENARLANPGGTITLSASAVPGTSVAEVLIEDQGAGVPKLIREHLGEPFFTTRDNGNGLGLFNAVTYAKALGGKLEVSDRLGGGAKISLHLPMLQTQSI